jgi:hypothetical protein
MGIACRKRAKGGKGVSECGVCVCVFCKERKANILEGQKLLKTLQTHPRSLAEA